MGSMHSVTIDLNELHEDLVLIIDARKENSLFEKGDAADNNEAYYQILEGNFYDFEFSSSEFYFKKDQIVQPHSRNKHIGIISPNIYVGTLSLSVFKGESEIGKVRLEVQSCKADYRSDYREMLRFITEKCTDLLLQANSPVSHYFDVDYSKTNESLYQKFAFIKSIIHTEEFSDSVHRIISAPVTRWKEVAEYTNIRKIKRFRNSNIKDLAAGRNSTTLPDNHYLNSYGLKAVPKEVSYVRKSDTVNTAENRFIKFALEVFLKFCSDINKSAGKRTRLFYESDVLINELESYLHHSVFKEISRPSMIKINSPVLQRKEGYREILRIWLMFDLAAKLVWKGGEDIYSGEKKDIATLYEYWLFFMLLDLFQTLFDIDAGDLSNLIQPTRDGLNLHLKQGVHTALEGVYSAGNRKLHIKFNYNRSFSGGKDYPSSGSWTVAMRPDYTLSCWPHGITESQAEKQELIVHIHFDAKYKIAPFSNFMSQTETNAEEAELDKEKIENRKGIYKNADLLKMHAYKDAIRRTGGAYVLYPGDKPFKSKGFHEIIPGLGAFPVTPSGGDSGINELKSFIQEVISHFVNRASQREKMAYRVYDIHKNDKPNEVKEALPEVYGVNRALIPDDTPVLIGYYHSEIQYNWIQKNKLYNFRMGTKRGALIIDPYVVGARYLLLHTKGDKSSGDIWRISSKGAKVFSKQDMIEKGYNAPSQDYYLIIELEEVNDAAFQDVSWEFSKLKNYSSGRASAVPFTATLTELMQAITR